LISNYDAGKSFQLFTFFSNNAKLMNIKEIDGFQLLQSHTFNCIRSCLRVLLKYLTILFFFPIQLLRNEFFVFLFLVGKSIAYICTFTKFGVLPQLVIT